MNLNRGDVGLAGFPHAAGGRGKKRPVVVVQADSYNQTLRHVIIAEVTGNLVPDPAHLPIDLSTPEGQATGVTKPSAVTCLHLTTVTPERVEKLIGKLSAGLLQKLDACLKAALGLP